MEKRITTASPEYKAFMDVFDLYKRIGTVEDTREYWDDAVQSVTNYMKEHPTPLGSQLGRAMMQVLVDENEEQWYSRMITYIGIKAMEDKEVARDLLDVASKVLKKHGGQG